MTHCFTSTLFHRGRMLIALLLVQCFVFSISAYAAELIPHKATYTTQIDKGIKIKGTAVRELKQLKDGNWLYRFDVESFAADISESVTFKWQEQKVVPLKYRYSLNGMFIKDRYQKINFNWTKNEAKGEHDGKKWELELKPNSLDRLGYQLQLLMDARFQSHTPIEYQIVHRKKHRQNLFAVQGEELLETRFGKVSTVKVIKQRSKNKTRKTHLWFSKEHPFLLLKMIQIEEDGEQYEINLSSAESNGKKLF